MPCVCWPTKLSAGAALPPAALPRANKVHGRPLPTLTPAARHPLPAAALVPGPAQPQPPKGLSLSLSLSLALALALSFTISQPSSAQVI